jgi:hypothetical protein
MQGKFALRNFAGEPVSYWLARSVDTPPPKAEKTLGHHIVIVDRSGSMWGEMDATKLMVEKVFTVEEFHDANLLVSLISYSSAGDVTTHFSRVPVRDVMDADKPYLASVRSIRATCLTSASQALAGAKEMIGDETTCISLHTDGWFNDASPASERKKIDAHVAELATRPNVMVNCIAYRHYSDFNYLSTVANRMSGKCVLASDVKAVYTALHDTTALLAGRVTPAIHVPAEMADWQAAYNVTQRKVNGSGGDLVIRGMAGGDDLRVIQYEQVNETAYLAASIPVLDATREGVAAIAAFARSRLAEGKINDAKFALVAMRLPTLLKSHYNALSSDRLTALAVDLEDVIYNLANPDGPQYVTSDTYGLGELADRQPLTLLFHTLNGHRGEYSVHLPDFTETYTRRGVRRLQGKFDDVGVFIPHNVELVEDVPLTEDPWVDVSGFEVNVAEATVNMQTKRDGVLFKDGQRVPRVAGYKLDLPYIRQYTVVGDGAVLASTLPLAIHSPALFAKLAQYGFVTGAFNPKVRVDIDLTAFPVVPLEPSKLQPPTVEKLTEYARCLMRRKFLEGCLPAGAKAAHDFTPEQLEELRSYSVSPAMYFVPPTTNPYTDRDAAAAEGLIDSYTRYTTSFGTPAATDLRTALWSANEYLARRFDVDDVKKPKMADLRAAKTVSEKALGPRVKLTPLDDLAFPVFREYIAEQVYLLDADAIKAKLAPVVETIDAMEAHLSALSLAIGSTGLVPDDWNAEVVTADVLEAKNPGIDLPKGHKDGAFFSIQGVYIGVHPEVAWFSTPKGIAEAERLQGK